MEKYDRYQRLIIRSPQLSQRVSVAFRSISILKFFIIPHRFF